MADAALAELIDRYPTREEISNAAEAATALAQARRSRRQIDHCRR